MRKPWLTSMWSHMGWWPCMVMSSQNMASLSLFAVSKVGEPNSKALTGQPSQKSSPLLNTMALESIMAIWRVSVGWPSMCHSFWATQASGSTPWGLHPSSPSSSPFLQRATFKGWSVQMLCTCLEALTAVFPVWLQLSLKASTSEDPWLTFYKTLWFLLSVPDTDIDSSGIIKQSERWWRQRLRDMGFNSGNSQIILSLH